MACPSKTPSAKSSATWLHVAGSPSLSTPASSPLPSLNLSSHKRQQKNAHQQQQRESTRVPTRTEHVCMILAGCRPTPLLFAVRHRSCSCLPPLPPPRRPAPPLPTQAVACAGIDASPAPVPAPAPSTAPAATSPAVAGLASATSEEEEAGGLDTAEIGATGPSPEEQAHRPDAAQAGVLQPCL